jgi:DNA primase
VEAIEMGVDTNVLLRHYATAGPLMERLFGAIPFVWTTLPRGVDGPKIYHGPLSEKTRPKGPVVCVPTVHGVRRYPALSAERIEGLVRHGAVEFYSWSPTVADPTRARFGRILVETRSDIDEDNSLVALENGLGALDMLLKDSNVESLRVYDGGTGAAMWIPFCDEPTYGDVLRWLHALCANVVERYPGDVTREPNSHGGAPAHLHVASNAVGRFSVLPYSVRARAGYPVAVPLDLEQVDHGMENGSVQADNFGYFMKHNQELFSIQCDEFWKQRFYGSGNGRSALPAQKSHGPIVIAAIEVLQDGRSHSAEEILQIALQRKLLDPKMTHKYVYTSLIEYIARANGNGRRPQIVQNADRSFRINEPADEWPALVEAPAPEPPAEVAALIERLEKTASGGAASDFEQAVCDAFQALGFAATHDGREKAPDGYADALLGPLGYRTMIECKSADEGVNDPSVFEAAKFRESYGAQFCALVARAFSGEIELVKELHNHGVSAWTVEDLQTLLRIGANPLEMKALFAPGFASDGLEDLLWERHHGCAKRVRLIADAIVRVGWATQAGYRGAPAGAPRITEDVAMVLVDQDLAAQGSAATCSRDDVRAAFDYLASPLVRLVERDAADQSVVVLSASMAGLR